MALGCTLLASCFHAPDYTLVNHAPRKPRLGERSFTSHDGQSFPYRKFIASDTNSDDVRTVVIGVHGFCGASIDYENLGHWLTERHPGIALYAYDVRGQGFDPLAARRGDIDSPLHWFHDLTTFTDLVQRRHPNAIIVWQGESMGALILAHTYRYEVSQGRTPPCEALILTSPVVSTGNGLAPWKKEGVRLIARTFPYHRVSLDALAGGQKIAMTSTSHHQEQSEVNAWHIEKHSLRLLLHLGNLVDQMPDCASFFQTPTLVAHGGQDFFASHDEVAAFCQKIPSSTTKKRLFYPSGHHLLMYDTQKERVLADISQWLVQVSNAVHPEAAYK